MTPRRWLWSVVVGCSATLIWLVFHCTKRWNAVADVESVIPAQLMLFQSMNDQDVGGVGPFLPSWAEKTCRILYDTPMMSQRGEWTPWHHDRNRINAFFEPVDMVNAYAYDENLGRVIGRLPKVEVVWLKGQLDENADTKNLKSLSEGLKECRNLEFLTLADHLVTVESGKAIAEVVRVSPDLSISLFSCAFKESHIDVLREFRGVKTLTIDHIAEEIDPIKVVEAVGPNCDLSINGHQIPRLIFNIPISEAVESTGK